VPYLLTTALIFAISCLLPPVEVPPMPSSVGDVVEAVSEARRAFPSAADALVTAARRLLLQLLTTTSHIQSVWYAYAIIAFWVFWVLSARPPVYLVDFTVYEPPADFQATRAELVGVWRKLGCYTEESIQFMARLLEKSGTGDSTHWPPGTLRILDSRGGAAEPDLSVTSARAVAAAVLCSCFEQLLARTGIKAKDVDFLIVNCSLFCPTPSLAAIVAQKFSLKVRGGACMLGTSTLYLHAGHQHTLLYCALF